MNGARPATAASRRTVRQRYPWLLPGGLLLLRVGAKRVYFESKEDVLLELLAQQLRANYARTDLNDRERSDSVAWLAKALGSSRNEKYTALLQEVAGKAPTPVVARHATDALVKYYGIRTR